MVKPVDKQNGRRARATIVDVAVAAGVHVSTASRALNPQTGHRISSRTVTKIQKVAQQLGYSPNPLASSLRTQRTGTIGIVVPNLSDPLFAPIIASVQERVAEDGFITFVASSEYKPDKLLSIIEIMSRQYVAGLVVASFELDDPACDLCLSLNIPTVAVLRDPGHPGLSTIAMDDVTGMADMVDHVRALGHRDIVYLTAPLAASTARNRLAGFTRAAKRAKASGCRFDIVEAGAYDVEAGTRVVERMIADGLRATAILCFNDLLAMGVLVALRVAGIACPDQVSVSGVNDLPFMGLLSPPLTSLHNAGRTLGLEGAEMLMKLIDDPKQPATRKLLPSPVVVRGSTGPARISVGAPTEKPPAARSRRRRTGTP